VHPLSQRRVTFTISLLVIIYVTLIALWAGLWWSAGDANWWLTLLNRFVPYLFAPAPLLLILTLSTRCFSVMFLLTVPLLIFGSLYHPYLLPKPPQAAQPPELSVMTYNVLFSNLEYEAVANVILAHHPDLVALQEVQPKMMGALQTRLEGEYPFSLMGTRNQYGTAAIFSRHPLTGSNILDLQADRPAVVAKTEIEGREVTFIAAHLLAYGLWWVDWADVPQVVMARTAAQNRQAQRLIEEVEKQGDITILGCDCNSKETSSSYRMLASRLKNTARQVGWVIGGVDGVNGKRDTNLQHIDYIFYRGELNPLSSYTVPDSGGSDHLPVFATYRFE
jgi:vancomycin resistance protein VanJ